MATYNRQHREKEGRREGGGWARTSDEAAVTAGEQRGPADMGRESAEATGMRESEPGYVIGSELAVRPFSRPVTFCFF